MYLCIYIFIYSLIYISIDLKSWYILYVLYIDPWCHRGAIGATDTFDTLNSKDRPIKQGMPTRPNSPPAGYANQAEQPSSPPKNPLEQPIIQRTVLVRCILAPICGDLRQNNLVETLMTRTNVLLLLYCV